MTDEIETIDKSHEVTIPAPGATMHAIKGRQRQGKVMMPNADKRMMFDIYYESYRKHPWVRASIDKIAKNASGAGYTFVASDPEKPFTPLHKDKVRKFFMESMALKLLRMTYRDLLIYGEGFWLIEKNRGRKPVKANRLHPKYMDAVLSDDGTEVAWWRYGPFHQDDDAIYYESDDIIHFAFEDPDSDLVGFSPLHSLLETISQDLFAMRFNRSFYENSAQTGVIFNMRNASTDEVTRNRQWLEENYTGANNAHRPIILEGDISIERSIANFADMEFTQGRELNRREIFAVLDIPPEKLGINEDSNRSTAKEAENRYHEETISPLQVIVEEQINVHIINHLFGFDDILFVNSDQRPAAKLAQMQYYRDAVRDGLMSRDEVRHDLGRGSVKGGDVVTVSTSAGMVPIEMLLNPPDPKTGAVGPPQDADPVETLDGVNPNNDRL